MNTNMKKNMKRNMKIAIFGAGSPGKNYVRIINKMGVLAAVVDSDELTRKRLQEDFPDVIITDDYKEILKNPHINGVIIAVPAVKHYQLTKDALLAGKDVLALAAGPAENHNCRHKGNDGS